jgi:hypothetical protein
LIVVVGDSFVAIDPDNPFLSVVVGDSFVATDPDNPFLIVVVGDSFVATDPDNPFLIVAVGDSFVAADPDNPFLIVAVGDSFVATDSEDPFLTVVVGDSFVATDSDGSPLIVEVAVSFLVVKDVSSSDETGAGGGFEDSFLIVAVVDFLRVGDVSVFRLTPAAVSFFLGDTPGDRYDEDDAFCDDFDLVVSTAGFAVGDTTGVIGPDDACS